MKPPTLSLALSALPEQAGAPWAGSPRRAFAYASSRGVRSVQLDATRSPFRPRELDRSARRDLAASLKRDELELSGLDLWIPPHHFSDAAHADRAVGATGAALQMARELADLVGSPAAVVSCTLPAELEPATIAALDAAAQGAGAVLADHAWPIGEGAADPATPGVRPGLDPATVILAGGDPVQAAGAHGALVASALVTDLSARGACTPGDRGGRLDLDAYAVSLGVAGTVRYAVFDPRGLPDIDAAVRAVVERWPTGLAFPG
jgi:hypothetical protein